MPLAAIRHVARLDRAAVQRTPEGLAIVLHAGPDAAAELVPLAPLAAVLDPRAPTTLTAAASAIVVVDGGALAVDRLGATDDTIVRALPAHTPVDPVVWGVALDVAGTPQPVFEPGALAAAIARVARDARPTFDDRNSLSAAARLPVLVVDDSLTTRMLERSILEAAGYTVDLASSAEEGLVKVAQARYAIVLVDVEMPGMDGFEFVAALRARPDTAALPAIMVTSRDGLDDRRRGAAAGAQGYIVKGQFDQVQLVATIERLVVAGGGAGGGG